MRFPRETLPQDRLPTTRPAKHRVKWPAATLAAQQVGRPFRPRDPSTLRDKSDGCNPRAEKDKRIPQEPSAVLRSIRRESKPNGSESGGSGAQKESRQLRIVAREKAPSVPERWPVHRASTFRSWLQSLHPGPLGRRKAARYLPPRIRSPQHRLTIRILPRARDQSAPDASGERFQHKRKIADQTSETWPCVWPEYGTDETAAHGPAGNPKPACRVRPAAAAIEIEGGRVIESILAKHGEVRSIC